MAKPATPFACLAAACIGGVALYGTVVAQEKATDAGASKGAASVAERVSSDPKVDAKKNRAYAQWEIHDEKRPKPPIITPPAPSTQDAAGTPPSDAVILFDGKDLSKWTAGGGKEAPWKVENGYMEAATSNIQTREPIGDCHLHIEFATPAKVEGKSQGRGNSGVLLMNGIYEVQVLDSYDNPTYADGQAAAIYGQNPPMVNASRGPGQWQQYDILWRGPRFDQDGKLTRPARVTVMHNGVYVQDNWTLTGGSSHHTQPAYKKHPEKLPLGLQFHQNTTRFRNLWYRPLPEEGFPNVIESGEAQPQASKAEAEAK